MGMAARFLPFGLDLVSGGLPANVPLPAVSMGSITAYSLLGSTGLIMKTDGELILAEPSPIEFRQLAAAKVLGDVVQPLHARYSRAILPELQARLATNALRLFDLVNAFDPRYVDVASHVVFNVNTREDLARADELAATCLL